MQQGWENMQENVQHVIPTGDLLDSNKSTISRKSDFGDLLVSRDEIVEIFPTVKNVTFLDLQIDTQLGQLIPRFMVNPLIF